MLPDADVLSFKFGVAYWQCFGHRVYPLTAVRLRGTAALRLDWPTMV